MTMTPLRHTTRYRRVIPTIRRVKPHVPYEHPDVPGVCHTCRLPILMMSDGRYTNERHVTLDQLLSQIVANDHDVMTLAAGERYG